MIRDPYWWINHFYYLDGNTIYEQFMQNMCAIIAAYYCWEMACNRYAKLQYSIAVHHWMSSIAALTIVVFDRFEPLLSWYGLIGIFCSGIPINFALTLRSSSYKKYNKLNRLIKFSLKFAAYWYLVNIIILFTGAILILSNQWLNGYYDGNTARQISFAITVICFIAFGYDDIITLRALFELSHWFKITRDWKEPLYTQCIDRYAKIISFCI